MLRSTCFFLVALAACSAPATDDDSASDESALGSRDGVAALHDFPAGEKVAATGVGTITENVGPSYKCRRRTLDRLPCGGWVSLSYRDGKTYVAIGAMGHDAFYSNVSGHSSLFPPPANNRFWNQSVVVELDATGHGHAVTKGPNPNALSGVEATWDVTATDGAVSVDFASDGAPYSCNRYEETCSFRVLAPE